MILCPCAGEGGGPSVVLRGGEGVGDEEVGVGGGGGGEAVEGGWRQRPHRVEGSVEVGVRVGEERGAGIPGGVGVGEERGVEERRRRDQRWRWWKIASARRRGFETTWRLRLENFWGLGTTYIRATSL